MAVNNWLLATHNKGKLVELRRLLGNSGIEMISLAEMGITEESPETGDRFLDNAMQKATFYQRLTGLPVLADDSGLEVDALNGAPGVHSARFGGLDSHDEKIAYLLDLIKDCEPDYRTARFRCVAVFFDGFSYISAEGVMEGSVGEKPTGNLGFGYDPIFIPEGATGSLGEMELTEKNKISHRGKAFTQLLAKLRTAVLAF